VHSALHGGYGNILNSTDHQIAGVAFGARYGKVRNRRVGKYDAIFKIISERA